MRTNFLLGLAALLSMSIPNCRAQQSQPQAPTQSLTLKQAEEIAVQNHPRITAAQLLSLAANETVREARSAYYPSVSVDATIVGNTANNTRVAAGGLNNPLILNREADGVNITQIITDFGRTANLTASSKLGARAQEQSALATREQILLEVDSAYFRALQAQAVLSVARQTVATRQLLFDQVSEQVTNKLKSGLDLSFAGVDLGQARVLLSSARNDLQAGFATLANLLGEREQRAYELSDVSTPVTVPDASQSVQQALQNRPDLAESRYARDAADRFARAEKDLNYPTVSAIGVAGIIPVHDAALKDNYAAAGLNFSMPIFEGMLLSAKQKEAEYRAKAAGENVRDLEDNVIRDVRVAVLNLEYESEQVELTAQLLASANEAFDLAQARYNVGSSDIVALSQAQLNKTQAEIAQARAKYEFQIRAAIVNFETGQTR